MTYVILELIWIRDLLTQIDFSPSAPWDFMAITRS